MLDEEASYYGEVLQLSKEKIMSKAFRSDEAAYEFYKRAGLRQRHHYDRLYRQRGHKPEMCTNCEAKLSVYLDVVSDEFEAEWDDTVEEYGFQNSFWAKETFQKRMMWANVYLRDKFCASFRTTSRCEGINVYVKNFLKSRHSLLDMVQNLGLVMREYQNNKLLAQFRSLHGIPVMTTCLDPLEKYAVDVYTHWRNMVTQHEHLTQIPERLVLKRWRKDAKSLDKYVEITEFGSKRGFLQRHELDRGHENICQKKAHDTIDLHDLDVVKTKGAPRVRRQGGRKRRCTCCRKTGYTKQHCNVDRTFVSKVEDNKDFEAINLGSVGSLPMERVDLEESSSKIRLEDEIPVATGCSEMMEYDRNMRSNTNELLTQLMTQIINISARLGTRLPAKLLAEYRFH
ncbi:hypothetical protein Ahy_A05g022584 [Arachis hypogaea]|uniref:Protein FAR1-RELATED SEQUENCE n=1 Tax=Arachis hypogaea TaxID=3818 RepID=A0A445D1B9_ARAHY|nr:hypothetical protein Ahy_A05g022584 [Arachis hypogaea]